MRIAITISHLAETAGGAERVVADLANHLSARRHKVTIISFEPDPSTVKKSFYQLDNRINIENVLSPAKAKLHNQIPSAAISESTYNKLSWFNQHMQTLQQLVEVLVRTKPDRLVAVLPSTFTSVAKLLEATNLPFILDNQNDPFVDYTNKRFSSNPYDVKLRFKAAELAATNIVLLDEYVNFFSEAIQKKTVVIPNPVHQLPPGKEATKKQNIVISVGRLEPVKNLETLIKAFSKVNAKHTNWQLHIYGHGSLEPKLKSLIDTLKMQDHIILKGVTKDIEKRLSEAQIYAQPSLFEGFSRALTEAMAHGLPSAVVDVCKSNKYLVIESGGGLVAKNTVNDLAQKIEFLIKNPGQRIGMGQKAREYVKRFSTSQVLESWEKVLLAPDKQISRQNLERLEGRAAELNKEYLDLFVKAVAEQYQQISDQKKQLRQKEAALKDLQESYSYKLGHTLLTPAKKVKSKLDTKKHG